MISYSSHWRILKLEEDKRKYLISMNLFQGRVLICKNRQSLLEVRLLRMLKDGCEVCWEYIMKDKMKTILEDLNSLVE